MGQEPNKIIYSMIQVSKHYDNKPVLKDISISFFYGAKIGVLGLTVRVQNVLKKFSNFSSPKGEMDIKDLQDMVIEFRDERDWTIPASSSKRTIASPFFCGGSHTEHAL